MVVRASLKNQTKIMERALWYHSWLCVSCRELWVGKNFVVPTTRLCPTCKNNLTFTGKTTEAPKFHGHIKNPKNT